MNICIDLTSLYDKLSGIEKFTLMITKNMIEIDSQNYYHIIFWNEVHNDFKQLINRENVNYSIIKGKNKLIMSQILLPIKLKKISADKYIFMAFPSPLLFRNKNIINVVHDMTPWLYPETMSKKGLMLFRALITNAINISEKIITVSNSSKNDIQNKFGNRKNIDVVFNGVDDIFQNFECDDKIKNEVIEKYNIPKKYILSLGTLEPRKNFKLLLQAFVELKNDSKIEHKLVIVGRKGWKYNSLLEGICGTISKDIIFTGFVETEHLPYIYKSAEVFVFPSIYEGFGIPVIEASAMECLVIVSDIPVLKEIVGEKAILFESDNKEELKRTLIETINLEASKKEYLRENLMKNSKKYSWRQEAEKMITILERRAYE